MANMHFAGTFHKHKPLSSEKWYCILSNAKKITLVSMDSTINCLIFFQDLFTADNKKDL